MRRTSTVVALAVAVVAVLLGGGGSAVVLSSAELRDAVAGVVSGEPPAPPAPAPVLAAQGPTTDRPHAEPLVLAVSGGSVRSLTVADTARGEQVPGAASADGAGWTSTAPLRPSSTYAVDAVLVAADGVEHSATLQVTTAPAAETSMASISPLEGQTVGIGMPVSVFFDRDVVDRAAVTEGLSVASTPAVEGGWRWFSDREVHWRPREYWPTGTSVTVSTRLSGTELAGGVYGTDRDVAFVVGRANVTTVDAAAHTMTVTQDGAVVGTYPVSTGNARYPTHGGVHIVLGKDAERTMDSATVGITGADSYLTRVKWATRISNSGEFVHAAPWSVGSQGRENVSHGCVNVSTAVARTFYELSQPGDVVEVVGTPAAPLPYDAGTMEWNMTWEEWLAG